jgi:Uma2 family endonuclease
MVANTIYREAPYKEKLPMKISIETFLRRYRKGGPGIKYEFNKGVIEKTDTIRFEEHFIILNLQEAFRQTQAFQEKALLTAELEVWTSEVQWRKPDLSFVTLEQTRAGYEGFEPVPEFVVEVISPNDKIVIIKNKIQEYFQAGVKIIWLVFPENKTVEIYRVNSFQNEVCSGEMPCSAEPVVPGFKVPTNEIFKKP